MDVQPQSVRGVVGRAFGGLRFPTLFLLSATLFVADLFVPDFVPLADEIMLGLLTLMLASWRTRKVPEPATTERE